MSFFKFTDRIRESLKPFYLFTYRSMAFLVISGSLVFMVGWAWVLLFFLVNTTWVAPTALSATSDKMLQFSSGYLTALQGQGTLKVALEQQQLALTTATHQKDLLIQYRNSIKAGSEIRTLKNNDLMKSAILLGRLNDVKQQVSDSLKAGLVSQTDATRLLTEIQQFENSTTDGKIGLESFNQQIMLINYQIAQLDDAIRVAATAVQEASKNLQVANNTISTLRNSAYYRATITGSDLVFVSYDNSNVREGQKLYGCYLMIIACHEVGTITHVYKDEQLVDFPLFNIRLSRTVRGVFAETHLADKNAIKSSVLFAGGKPLFF